MSIHQNLRTLYRPFLFTAIGGAASLNENGHAEYGHSLYDKLPQTSKSSMRVHQSRENGGSSMHINPLQQQANSRYYHPYENREQSFMGNQRESHYKASNMQEGQGGYYPPAMRSLADSTGSIDASSFLVDRTNNDGSNFDRSEMIRESQMNHIPTGP